MKLLWHCLTFWWVNSEKLPWHRAMVVLAVMVACGMKARGYPLALMHPMPKFEQLQVVEGWLEYRPDSGFGKTYYAPPVYIHTKNGRKEVFCGFVTQHLGCYLGTGKGINGRYVRYWFDDVWGVMQQHTWAPGIDGSKPDAPAPERVYLYEWNERFYRTNYDLKVIKEKSLPFILLLEVMLPWYLYHVVRYNLTWWRNYKRERDGTAVEGESSPDATQ